MLKEIDSTIPGDVNDRLLPAAGVSQPEPVSAGFPFACLRANLRHFDVEQRFDRRSNVTFRRFGMNLECVLVVSRRPMDTLFGDEGPEDDLVREEPQTDQAAGFGGCRLCHFNSPDVCTLFTPQTAAAEAAKLPSLIRSSAAFVTSIRRGLSTDRAFSSRTGETETPSKFRELM